MAVGAVEVVAGVVGACDAAAAAAAVLGVIIDDDVVAVMGSLDEGSRIVHDSVRCKGEFVVGVIESVEVTGEDASAGQELRLL